MKKIVVLNSGGFDSIVLVHHLNYTQSDSDIHSLHFSYGELNHTQQIKCVSKVCEKFGLHNVILNLPKFEWTNSKFYEEDYSYETQYLEYRNLIFLSYAASYAESIGAEEIYLATCKGAYNDVNDDFFNGLNEALKSSGISIIRPFCEVEYKDDLIPLALEYGVTNDDYFSCDVPKDGKPCGKCDDCMAISCIAPVLEANTPDKDVE